MARRPPSITAFAQFYKVNPTGVVIWRQCVSNSGYNRFNFHDPTTPKEKKITYQGEITQHSRKRLAKALQLLIEITDSRWVINPVNSRRMRFSLAFWTLTLSASQGFTSDSEIKKTLLEPFLRKMRKKGLRNYVWKSELQQNGNLHFHLLTDLFLPYTVIRDVWNNCQSKLGYISDFERRFGHRDPNSTDVRSVKDLKGIASYLAKYMLKASEKGKQQKISPIEDQKRKGKIWDCSLNLKLKNQAYDFLPDYLYDTLEILEAQGDIRGLHTDFYKCFFIDKTARTKLIPKQFLASYKDFISKVKSAS